MQPNIYNTEKNVFIERTRLQQKLLKVGAVLPFAECDLFLEVLEAILKHLGRNGSNFHSNPVFQFLYRTHRYSKNTILKMTTQEVVWGTEVWTPRWPDACGNDAGTEKGAQKLEHFSCGVCRLPILLKPAVLLFHFQHDNKLGYDIAVHLSRNSGHKKIGPMIRFWEMPHQTTSFSKWRLIS